VVTKRCTNFGGAVVSVLQADIEFLDAEKLPLIGSAACSENDFLGGCCLSFSSLPLIVFMWHEKLSTSSKIYQNFYQSDPFSSVVKSGMPLNQL